MEINKEGKYRIEVIDSLRGFAIMGIMLLHSIEHFNFYVFPDSETQPAWLNNMDSIVWDSLFFMFSGNGSVASNVMKNQIFYIYNKKDVQRSLFS